MISSRTMARTFSTSGFTLGVMPRSMGLPPFAIFGLDAIEACRQAGEKAFGQTACFVIRVPPRGQAKRK
jgi:hypothetical protein